MSKDLPKIWQRKKEIHTARILKTWENWDKPRKLNKLGINWIIQRSKEPISALFAEDTFYILFYNFC